MVSPGPDLRFQPGLSGRQDLVDFEMLYPAGADSRKQVALRGELRKRLEAGHPLVEQVSFTAAGLAGREMGAPLDDLRFNAWFASGE
jgi:hypothetical protein